MKILFKYNDTPLPQRLLYILNFIEYHPNCNGNLQFVFDEEETFDILISYGKKIDQAIYIPEQKIFFTQKQAIENTLFANTYLLDDLKIFSVENEEKELSAFFNDGAFSFDLFETIFFHISRFEEFFPGNAAHDNYGAMENQEMFLVKNKLEKIPVVDHLVFAFYKSLSEEIISKNKTEYHMTHDIDKIFKYNSLYEGLKSILWPLIFVRNLSWSSNNLRFFFNKIIGKAKDPYDSYDFLFKKSSKWKSKIVYFMAGGRTRYDLFDGNYVKHMKSVWKKAEKSGYVAGLHPSFDTVDNGKMMRKEKFNLEKVLACQIELTRQHFLHYFPGKTDQLIEECSFRNDSTLGFNRLIGFRCGTGFDYKLYDFENEKAFEFSESPLVVMDSSLIHETGDNMEVFEQKLIEFIEANRYLTCISFNFHNSTFDPTMPHRRKLKVIYESMESIVFQDE